jgi:chromate transporter
MGIKPAVLAIILSAVWKLGRKAVKNRPLATLGGLSVLAVLAGGDELLVLLAGGILGTVAWGLFRGRRPLTALLPWAILGTPAVEAERVPISLIQLALFFLKVGATLYGSGYVLVAYLQGGLVERFGWLTQEQLLDAIAMGQFTPGPVLTTATFVGFILAGPAGAAVATLAIFLPSFLFVLALNPLIPRMRRSPWLSAFLDAINVTAVGLMAAVLLLLGRATLTGPGTILIAAFSAVAVFRFKLSPIWIVLGSAGLGAVIEAIS